MYVPAHFKAEDEVKLRSFIEENSFATVITHHDGRPFASHLPVLIGNPEGVPTHLLAHVARANPQWQHFQNREEILLIFHGPHAYISPFWYQTREAVPTWNYATVHAYGTATVIQDETRAKQLVQLLTRLYEGDRAEELFQRWSEPFVSRMLKSIVAFEVQVTRLEGKFKLGQNRVPADNAGTLEALLRSSDPSEQALAKLMQQEDMGTKQRE